MTFALTACVQVHVGAGGGVGLPGDGLRAVELELELLLRALRARDADVLALVAVSGAADRAAVPTRHYNLSTLKFVITDANAACES